jgi:hypothetical protein
MTMEQFRVRLKENTLPFDSWATLDFGSAFKNSRLIGLGEVPHNVSEYFDFLIELTRHALSTNQTVLLILELPFWMDRYLNAFVKGQDDRLIELTLSDPEEKKIYSKGLIDLFWNLRKVQKENAPNALVCKCMDVYMHTQFQKKAAWVASVEPKKFAESEQLAQLLKERKLEEYCLQREEFLFSESSSAIDLYVPDKILLHSGSYHANHVDGMPMGSMYIKPVFARIAEHYKFTALNARLFPIYGSYAKYFKVDGMLQLGVASCAELFPDGPKKAMREMLRNQTGQSKKYITNMKPIREDQTISPEYLGFALEYDYQISFANVHAAITED